MQRYSAGGPTQVSFRIFFSVYSRDVVLFERDTDDAFAMNYVLKFYSITESLCVYR